ncbi:HNH endonuclease, partial [Porticoccaceae bacterium]|nr:HNH endonuclease [Porticoccaceae bacterium]
CQTEGCGFHAAPFSDPGGEDGVLLGEDVTGYMQVSHINGDHSDNRIDNLMCVCPYCHLSDHPMEAIITGKADLICAPYKSQLEINAIAMVINRTLCHDAGAYYKDAQELLDILMKDSDEQMSAYIKEYPKLQSSRRDQQLKFCYSIANMMMLGDENHYLFEPLRLFPRGDFFKLAHDFWNEKHPLPRLEHWAQAAYG